MASLHTLKPAEGAVKKKKRIGRGNASGHGTTAGRGTKGQLSRSGGGKGPGFEGGRMPLIRRLPHLPGFKNPFKVYFQVVSLDKLNNFDEKAEVTPQSLLEAGVIKNLRQPVKVLANGKIEKALTVKANAFSLKAKELIEKAGGKTEVI
jgi:large subunit ribosomal protein L15